MVRYVLETSVQPLNHSTTIAADITTWPNRSMDLKVYLCLKYHIRVTSIMVQNVPCLDVVLHVSYGKVNTARSTQPGWISSSVSSVLVFCTKWKWK